LRGRGLESGERRVDEVNRDYEGRKKKSRRRVEED
jgi:hypothetical protein